jgi:hypothetical protein
MIKAIANMAKPNNAITGLDHSIVRCASDGRDFSGEGGGENGTWGVCNGSPFG